MDTNWNNTDNTQSAQSGAVTAPAAGVQGAAEPQAQGGRKKGEKAIDPARKNRACLRRMLYRWAAWVLLGAALWLGADHVEMVKALTQDPYGVLSGRISSAPGYWETIAEFGERTLSEYQYTARLWQVQGILLVGALALSLLLFLYIAIRAKDVRAGKALVAGALGRVWLEIKILAAVGLAAGIWQVFRYPAGVLPEAWLVPIYLGIYLLWADLCGNGMRLYECSLCALIGRGARGWAKKQPWQRKVLGGFGAGMLAAVCLTFTAGLLISFCAGPDAVQAATSMVLCLLAAAGCLFAAFWVLRRLVAEWALVAGKLADLRAGRPSAPLALPEGSLLAGPAEDLNSIEEGVARAVEQRSRADRMKVELITNVSHDIKTPLTSILSYADLLCAEPGLPKAAAGYARILQQKATQLRGMVQDVFELSKAASGELPVELAPLDLAKLIRQTMADMEERLDAAPVAFRTRLAPEAWVLGDGERLYRVFQNLLINAAQYSMPASRVYVTLTAENGQAVACVKNIANYELAAPGGEAEGSAALAELTERFVRGDASRSSEGSGLGLSIAKSFTEACGGQLSLRAEADLFVVSVSLPLIPVPGGAAGGMAPDAGQPAAETTAAPAPAAKPAAAAASGSAAAPAVPDLEAAAPAAAPDTAPAAAPAPPEEEGVQRVPQLAPLPPEPDAEAETDTAPDAEPAPEPEPAPSGEADGEVQNPLDGMRELPLFEQP